VSKSSRGWLAGTALLLLLIAAAVYFFEWNMLRGPIARRVEQATGRTFSINGDLRVQLSRRPRVTIDGLDLGNASWSSNASMGEIQQLVFTIDPWALLRGRIVLPDVTVSGARISLEKNGEGVANWHFDKRSNSTLPSIGALVIDQAHIGYRDPVAKTDSQPMSRASQPARKMRAC
jgi:uncharacterized protein involved in outer membrane biogenesis